MQCSACWKINVLQSQETVDKVGQEYIYGVTENTHMSEIDSRICWGQILQWLSWEEGGDNSITPS